MLILSGCGSANIQQQYTDLISQGRYGDAYQLTTSVTGENAESKGRLLWQLDGGLAAFYAGEDEEALRLFDYADQSFRDYDARADTASVAEISASLLWNDNALPFKGHIYDRIMVNTYKGLLFLKKGDRANARVEFNRALYYQDEAKWRFQREIAKQRESLEKTTAENQINTNKGEDAYRESLEKRYVNIPGFRAYPDFVNPFASYVAGIAAWLEGDFGKAADLVKAAYGMMPENRYAKEELGFIDARMPAQNRVWVICENGLSPELTEQRLDFPTWIFTSRVMVSSFAIPVLRERPAAISGLLVNAGGKRIPCDLISDMDRVVRTEYAKTFPSVLAREIMRMILKSSAQYAVNRSSKDSTAKELTSIGLAIFQIVSTAADLRQWSSLPKNIHVASFPIPADRRLSLGAGDMPIGKTIEIPPCNNAIILYRVPPVGGTVVSHMILFGPPKTLAMASEKETVNN